MDLKQKLFQRLEQLYPSMVQLRRYFHQYPEVSFHEFKTAQTIATFYENIQIPIRTNVGGNGIVATIKGEKPGKTIALRADFDALPIQDLKDADYRSKVPGVMHACGHDGHTSTLLHLARTFAEFRHELPGTFVFIHQHAEEMNPGGAKSMIEAGCLEGVDAIFGTHLWSLSPLGEIGYRSGPIMAAADRFEIDIFGQGGHGAAPHEAKDAIVIGAQVITALQTIVSRNINPIQSAVLSVGSLEAKNAFNIIADHVTMSGTTRSFAHDVREQLSRDIDLVLKGLTTAFGSHYDYEFIHGYPPVINDEAMTNLLKESCKTVPHITPVNIEPKMIGEDFAYYLEEVPGSFFFTGARPKGVVYPHHHPKFDFDERAMLHASQTLGAVAIDAASEER